MRYIYFIAFLALVACSEKKQEFKSEQEFLNYINDPENGFIQKEESRDLIFETRVVPPVKGEGNECTVHLRIRRKDGGEVLMYGDVPESTALEREGYLTFEVIGDVSLKMGKKFLDPVFHHYERNFHLKPSIDMYFVFDNLQKNTEAEFRYRDQLFGQGLVSIKLNEELFNECYVAKNN